MLDSLSQASQIISINELQERRVARNGRTLRLAHANHVVDGDGDTSENRASICLMRPASNRTCTKSWAVGRSMEV